MEAPVKKPRIPHLDGLRGIAILCVIASHAKTSVGVVVPSVIDSIWTGLGGRGVSLFFALSGYLITNLLIAEKANHGKIDLAKFYARRSLRIIPAFVLYISCIWSLVYWGILAIPSSDLLYSFLLLQNYNLIDVNTDGWYLAHLWTLSIEEQFYLFWPLLVLYVSRPRLLVLCISIALIMPIVRVGHYFLFPSSRSLILTMFHTSIDFFMYGCALSLLGPSSKLVNIFKIKHFWVIPVVLFLWLFFIDPVLYARYRGGYALAAGVSITSLAIASFLGWVVHNCPATLSRLLDSRCLAGTGGISYGLYLWQQLLLPHDQSQSLAAFWISAFPVNILVLFTIAWLSYIVIERQFQRFRNRFAVS